MHITECISWLNLVRLQIRLICHRHTKIVSKIVNSSYQLNREQASSSTKGWKMPFVAQQMPVKNKHGTEKCQLTIKALKNNRSYLDSAYKELTPIGVGACICHANNSRSHMRHYRDSKYQCYICNDGFSRICIMRIKE